MNRAAQVTEDELRVALIEGRFQLHYQPIVSLGDRRIAGFEALMRWDHPLRGRVPPDVFIPIAEQTGLIAALGRWAVRTASAQLAQWQRRHPRRRPLFMSVNVSPQQFRDDDLLDLVREVLMEHRIPPATLVLEITEGLMMQDPAQCRAVMQQIRNLDVRLSIDDFGTGYSSLAYLHEFPADTLKIDRTFVSAIGTGERRAAIVQVITTLATIPNMKAVAEGVETEEQAEYLNDVWCRFAQGYLFSPPVPADRIDALLADELAVAA